MIGMTFEQQAKLCEMIETAVATNKAIVFPSGLNPVLQVHNNTFTIPGLFWMDEQRNMYIPFMKMEFRSKDDPYGPGLYVVGSKGPDGRSSGIVSMFTAENRYQTVL